MVYNTSNSSSNISNISSSTDFEGFNFVNISSTTIDSSNDSSGKNGINWNNKLEILGLMLVILIIAVAVLCRFFQRKRRDKKLNTGAHFTSLVSANSVADIPMMNAHTKYDYISMEHYRDYLKNPNTNQSQSQTQSNNNNNTGTVLTEQERDEENNSNNNSKNYRVHVVNEGLGNKSLRHRLSNRLVPFISEDKRQLVGVMRLNSITELTEHTMSAMSVGSNTSSPSPLMLSSGDSYHNNSRPNIRTLKPVYMANDQSSYATTTTITTQNSSWVSHIESDLLMATTTNNTTNITNESKAIV